MCRTLAGLIALSLTSTLTACGGFADPGQPTTTRRIAAQPCGCAAAFVLDGVSVATAYPEGCFQPVGADPTSLPACADTDQAPPPVHPCACAQELVVGGELVAFRSPAGCYTSVEAPDALGPCRSTGPVHPAPSVP